MAEKAGDYSEAKVNFVKNLNGTSTLEITSLVTCTPLCYLFYFLICCRFILRDIHFSKGISMILESIFLVLPNLLVLTMLEGHAVAVNIFQLVACAVLTYKIVPANEKIFVTSTSGRDEVDKSSKRKQFISNFRAFMLIATIISILAVDFSIFPRRYAKAEVYGTGFMDIGIGSFVFGHAIVSQFAKGPLIQQQEKKFKVILKNIAGCMPILCLGFFRLVTVKASGYHEHVTEYGIHWNFFFTLAFVKLFTGTLLAFLSDWIAKGLWLLGIAVCVSYQILLSHFGLENFVRNGSFGDSRRGNLIDANREGIVSLAGYIGLYLLASQLGQHLFQQRSKYGTLRKLIQIDIILWMALSCCMFFVAPVSRQLANVTYILWIMALNVYLLVCFLAVEVIQDYIVQRLKVELSREGPFRNLSPRRPLRKNSSQQRELLGIEDIEKLRDPLLVQAINRNQLLYFLVGNMLTGFVNMTLKTIYVDNATAMIVMILYVTLINGVIVIFHVKNIYTKFW